MKLRPLLVATLSLLLPSALFAQSKPLDRSEILGRLATGESPSYVAHLVKVRALTFSPDGRFLSQIRLAGGEGILIQRLQSAPAPARPEPFYATSISVDHLARCAELVHTQLFEEAEAECRKSIEENPLSPWPLIAVARLPQQMPRLLMDRQLQTPEARKDLADLLRRALALAPDLSIAHFSLAALSSPQDAMRELKGASRLDKDNLDEISEASTEDSLREISGLGRSLEDTNSQPPPSIDNPITLDKYLELRIAAEPDLARNHLALAGLYFSVQNFDRVDLELQEALRLEPDSLHLVLAQAMFYLERHQHELALSGFRRAINIAPSAVLPHMMLAAAYSALHRSGEAIDALKLLQSLRPLDPLPGEILARLYTEMNDSRSAAAELQRSLNLGLQGAMDQASFVKNHFYDYARLAELFRETRQLNEAASQYETLLRSEPDSGDLHNDYGNILLDLARIDEAIAEYREALRIDPSMSSPHHNIGLCLLRQKHFDGAVSEFRQALALNPSEPNTKVFLATALSHKGDLAGARQTLHDAATEDSDNPQQHLNLAIALEEMKDSAGALQELNRAYALSPGSLEVENDLAWFYVTASDVRLRNPVIALSLARRVVRFSPQPIPAYLDTLAEALLVYGQPADALTTELQAYNVDPGNPEIRSRLAHFREAAQASASSKP